MVQSLSELGKEHLLLFFLLLTRLSFVLTAMPGLGPGIPRRVKALFLLAMTVLLFPLMSSVSVPETEDLASVGMLLAREASIGALIGLVIRLLMTGLQLAGEMISATGGMQLGAGVDPQSETPMPVLSNLVGMLVAVIFIGVGGHHMMIDALLLSFETMPPGILRVDAGWIELLTYELSMGMAVGIRAGAPVIAALLLSNLITGLLSRTLPQLNILAVGLNINALALLTVSAVAIGSAGILFEAELHATVQRLFGLLRTG